MKEQLFAFCSYLGASYLWLLSEFFNSLINLLSFLGNLIRSLSAKLIQAFLTFIFPEQVAEVENEIKLTKEQTELKLLASASKLKEHAIEYGEWTSQHTEAIEAIGNALLNECDWESSHIHQYLQDVIESVPGLQYRNPDDPLDGMLE